MQNPDDLLDTMTGLLGRQGFLLILQDRMDAGSKFQLIVTSLDEMKITNNLVGRRNGDRLLQEIAGCLLCSKK
ncbi:MAG: diguanylate cyclase [Negativicutes bacterium]|nr:diguanylate cyclase [Negativicutes bacterium]